jgi:hypothetical protein
MPNWLVNLPNVGPEVPARVAHDFGWRPVPELIKEILDGDSSVRGDRLWA